MYIHRGSDKKLGERVNEKMTVEARASEELEKGTGSEEELCHRKRKKRKEGRKEGRKKERTKENMKERE